MKQIKIFDTTLRDGEQSPGCSMNLPEKLKMAEQLERLKVDIIEAGFPTASKGDFEAVRAIAETVKNCTVAGLARASFKDIDDAYDAVKVAAHPRIHLFIATSPVHMKYKLNMSPQEVLQKTIETVAYAKRYCDDIEFSAEDASRSNVEFLIKVFQAAVDNGATVLNIPDTVGYGTPGEMFQLVKTIKENLTGIENVDLSVHCHNDLGMAVANTLAAVQAGATQVEGAMNGIGERAGNVALEEVIMAIKTRKDFYDCYCNVDTKQIYRTSKLLSSIIGVNVTPSKAIVGVNAFAHEAGIHQHGVLSEKSTYEIMSPQDIGLPENKMVLGKHSGKHALEQRLKDLGFQMTQEELVEVFEKFKALADKKKTITDDDLIALVGMDLNDMPDGYECVRFVVNSGSTIPATSTVRLKHSGEEIEEAAMGDGPIDATYKAINKIIKMDIELADYSIRSISDGHDALGEVIVKIKYKEGIYTGRGVSTDIIESSIKAYLNGINKVQILIKQEQ